MAFRHRANPRRDKRRFSHTASKVHTKNNRMPMRGGFRL